MRRGLRGAAGDDEADEATAPDVGGVPAAAFTALVEAMTNAITAAVTAATSIPGSVSAAAKKTRISTAINPYDTESMNLS